jgi:arginine/lysine/ornithine decarboxylase
MGLRDLADEMFDHLKTSRQTKCMAEAFSTLPEVRMTPAEAYRELVLDNIEHVELAELADRIVATSVVPYPPGIPMLMPGESFGPEDGPYLGYLRALKAWDARFPGFGHDTHGIEVRDGGQYLQCLKKDTAKAKAKGKKVTSKKRK